jgi:hypothetical protein
VLRRCRKCSCGGRGEEEKENGAKKADAPRFPAETLNELLENGVRDVASCL